MVGICSLAIVWGVLIVANALREHRAEKHYLRRVTEGSDR